ncbi:MAG: diacylglycerol kinase family protein [Tahibacter sp.]
MNTNGATSVAVVINDTAGCGHGEEVAATVRAGFAEGGCEPTVHLVPAAQIQSAVRDLVRDGARIIVAGGGDGTISAVAAELAGSGVALGVLPLGTLNHFAKDVGIPLDLPGAIRTVLDGHAIDVDIGEVNGKVFINNSSIGVYPQIVRMRERHRRRFGLGKWIAMIMATWHVLRLGSSLRVLVNAGSGERKYRTAFAFAGNNAYVLEGLEMGSRKSLQGGKLSLYTARPTGRLGILSLTVQALFGRLRDSDDFDEIEASDILIETTQRRLSVATDGEVAVLETPLRYRSRAAALRVLVPRTEVAEGV